MFIKCISIIILTATAIHAEESEKFFRSDYTYIKDTESFYKIQTAGQTWEEAKDHCEMEGASFFYPEDSKEAEVIISHWNKTIPFMPWIFIGVADWNAKHVYETIDGRSISDVYNAWGYGEPNNTENKGCVTMLRNGTLITDSCKRNQPSICKKTLATLQWNSQCDIPYSNYEYHPTLDRCYKFHLKPKSWYAAYTTCRIEQSYLAIINSAEEAAHLVNLTKNAPKDEVKGDYLRGAVHLGFKNLNVWITAKGVLLDQSGYNTWGYLQPDGGDKENCGSMFYSGRLNDIGCFQKMFFICEHDVKVQSGEYLLDL